MNQSCFARFSSRLLIAVVISASTPVGAEINTEQAQSTHAPDNYENEQYKVGSGDLLKITIFNQIVTIITLVPMLAPSIS